MPIETKLYVARAVLTMSRSWPVAEAVLVREGRIVAAGSREELGAFGALDEQRFANHLVPP